MKIFTNASMLKMMIIGLCLTTSACGGYKLELPIVSGAPSEEEPTQGNATKKLFMISVDKFSRKQ